MTLILDLELLIFLRKGIFRMSLKKFALESRRRIYAQLPPELFRMKREDEPDYSRIQEPDFVEKISAGWIAPAAVDTTYFCLQIFEKMNESISSDKINEISNFVKSLYSKGDGGFLQTKLHDKSSVHAVHSVIGILNVLYAPNKINNGQLDWSKPLGKTFMERMLGSEKAVASVLAFLDSCKIDSGFAETPGGEATINATASVLWCLWHLDSLEERCDVGNLLGFVKKHVSKENGMIGFKNVMTDKRAWICATYYAYRILKTIGKKPDDLSIDFDEEKVIKFIAGCKTEEGGFGASEKFKPTIIHTKDVLSLISSGKYLNSDGIVKSVFINNNGRWRAEMNSFLDSCCYKGAYGFAETQYYFPNVYATQLALDIKVMVNKVGNNGNGDCPVTLDQKKEILSFIDSCYDNTSGGYSGYSKSTNYIPDNWNPN